MKVCRGCLSPIKDESEGGLVPSWVHVDTAYRRCLGPKAEVRARPYADDREARFDIERILDQYPRERRVNILMEIMDRYASEDA